jgi:hypothetical protein
VKNKSTQIEKPEQKVKSTFIPSSLDIVGTTDIPRIREVTRANLARYIVIGVFILLFIISSLLFLLIIFNKQEAVMFKDILLSFIGFSSGILVSIFGFYFKGKESEN